MRKTIMALPLALVVLGFAAAPVLAGGGCGSWGTQSVEGDQQILTADLEPTIKPITQTAQVPSSAK